jgi:hypothetical protein
MLRIICILVCFCLSSCSDEEKLIAVLNSYKGYNIDTAIKILGSPRSIAHGANTNTYRFGFSELGYIPQYNSTTTSGSVSPFGRVNLFSNSSSFGGYYYSYGCDLLLLVDTKSNNVISYQWNGDSCKNYAKRRYLNPQYLKDLPRLKIKLYGMDYKKVKKGIKITNITKNGAAEKSGLQKNDIVTKINGENVVGLPEEIFSDFLDLSKKKNKVELTIQRKRLDHIIQIPVSEKLQITQYKKATQKFLGFDPRLFSENP